MDFDIVSELVNFTRLYNESEYLDLNGTYAIELEQFYNFRIVLSWLSFIIIILGLCLNTISVQVFTQKNNISSTNILIAFLSISAILVLFCMLINHVIYTILIGYNYFNLVQATMFILPYTHPVYMTFYVNFIYLTMSISLNQFIYVHFSKGYKKIRKNFKKKKLIQESRNSCLTVFIIHIFSVLFCMPYWFRLKYTEPRGVEKTLFGKSDLFNKIYQCWLYLPLVGFLPCLTLIMTNLYLIITLTRTAQRKSALSSKRNETSRLVFNFDTQSVDVLKRSDILKVLRVPHGERITSVMRLEQTRMEPSSKARKLIIAVGFFLVCQTPNLILNVMESFKEDDLIQIDENYLIEISRFMVILNFSFNFSFVYLISFYKKK